MSLVEGIPWQIYMPGYQIAPSHASAHMHARIHMQGWKLYTVPTTKIHTGEYSPSALTFTNQLRWLWPKLRVQTYVHTSLVGTPLMGE